MSADLTAGKGPPAARHHTKILKNMTDIALWVSILGLFGTLISIMPLDFISADPPAA